MGTCLRSGLLRLALTFWMLMVWAAEPALIALKNACEFPAVRAICLPELNRPAPVLWVALKRYPFPPMALFVNYCMRLLTFPD